MDFIKGLRGKTINPVSITSLEPLSSLIYFRGDNRPAEDCLLKPEDLQKWMRGDAVTKADTWTRCPEAYTPESNDDQQPIDDHPTKTRNYSSLSERFDGRDTMNNTQSTSSAGVATPDSTNQRRKTIAGGKTAAEIIAEAKAKPKQKMTWKEKFSKGATTAMMGNSG